MVGNVRTSLSVVNLYSLVATGYSSAITYYRSGSLTCDLSLTAWDYTQRFVANTDGMFPELMIKPYLKCLGGELILPRYIAS